MNVLDKVVDTLFTYPALGVAVYCFQCYCFACVVSQYQELSEGRGTYEFLYKPVSRSSYTLTTQVVCVCVRVGQ